ncbi:hypothetical protein PO903_10575 [Paenibacillus sp. PK4536]|uniref:hypothetical protein n=1 Tax=unclassified Paenibacillus TaxID=185978 RepID=UPI0010BFACD2|nr:MULTISPECIES: hypothetical protein [unclassified Paenibacillus]TKJ93402.1 hypothetical protein PaeCFBP13512_03110 [Paenibacillus sp. CFBP13512]WIM41286.1 hypothetical protein PO903_10575 [Paenibacillus sp. PK4536]
MKTIIEFIENPETGQQEVYELINKVRQEASQSVDQMQMFKFIMNGLEFLEKHGIPIAAQKYFVDMREDGRPYTIQLVKELRNHVPLLEFRVNWKGLGAFRAIFFEYYYSNTQILIFTKSIIKKSTYSQEFEEIVQQSELLYSNFLENPHKYIHLEEVGTNESS